jgi:c(7)-type cytochrome triheme protein
VLEFIFPAKSLQGWLSKAGIALLALLFFNFVQAQGKWDPLARDGLHDPLNPGFVELQEPGTALDKLPPGSAGNQVNWIEAIENGSVKPRPSIRGAQAKIRDQDILLSRNGGLPMVLFSHRKHGEWLDCSNCHDSLFKEKTGTSGLSMFRMLNGEQCGVCHGSVSFPLTECRRCHNVQRPAPESLTMPARAAGVVGKKP